MRKIISLLTLLAALSLIFSGCKLQNIGIKSEEAVWPVNINQGEIEQENTAQSTQNEASIIYESGTNLDLILKNSSKVKNVKDQIYAMKTYTDPLTKNVKNFKTSDKYAINNFIVYGTKSVLKFTAKQRAGMVESYQDKNHKLPTSNINWLEVLNLANEPSTVATSDKNIINGVKPTQTEATAADKLTAKQQQCLKEGGDLLTGKSSNSSNGLNITVNPMAELDFKTKSEIFDIRRSYINKYPELIRADYKPSDQVFGQIQDKKAWWGMKGTSCNGNGKDSIEGVSEESRFIVNPYLLIGLKENGAYIIKGIACSAIYPQAIKLFWHCSNNWGKVIYDISDYMKNAKIYYPNADELYLVAYNARDYGFNYLFIDPSQASGVETSNFARQPVPLKQFIHTGGSCGYPGGCNNMSPEESHLVLKISSLPASVKVKLWKKAPTNAEQKPDMVFIIEMK